MKPEENQESPQAKSQADVISDADDNPQSNSMSESGQDSSSLAKSNAIHSELSNSLA